MTPDPGGDAKRWSLDPVLKMRRALGVSEVWQKGVLYGVLVVKQPKCFRKGEDREVLD